MTMKEELENALLQKKVPMWATEPVDEQIANFRKGFSPMSEAELRRQLDMAAELILGLCEVIERLRAERDNWKFIAEH